VKAGLRSRPAQKAAWGDGSTSPWSLSSSMEHRAKMAILPQTSVLVEGTVIVCAWCALYQQPHAAVRELAAAEWSIPLPPRRRTQKLPETIVVVG